MKNLKAVVSYGIVGLISLFVFPALGIIVPTFMLCGVVAPIAGLVKFIGSIFGADLPIITFQIGSLTLNPFLTFLASIITGFVLFVLGVGVWKLLRKYLEVVSNLKKRLLA